MFEVTVYTDARAGEALDGVAGFNFVAASPGITAVEQKFIKHRMLHVVKSSWHVDHSDDLAHPPTCTYQFSDGRYFLSRGRSTGLTVTAPRPGNQVTQTIVTNAADDFVPFRPAQLFAANEWNLSRETGGKRLSPWPTPLEVDPSYEADELKRTLVDGTPFGTEFLPAYLTMVEQAVSDPGAKLIIVHTDIDLVMRYIALASLFLDAERALAMSFTAFADQPLAAVADIVGATPDFGPTPSAQSGRTSYNVVDVLAVQMSPVEVSQSAARQAEWFMGDPFDALAAIDVARRWETALGADVATDAAGIVSFTDNSVASPHDRAAALRAICGLAAAGLGDDLAMYSDELLDAVVMSPPSCDADIALAADAVGATRQAGMDEVGTGILLPTLEVLASRPDLISTWGTASTRWTAGPAPLRWESNDSRGHALQAQSEIINRTSPEHLADVLIAAKIANLLPDEALVGQALDRLSGYWCQHPELSALRGDLPYQPQLGARLSNRIIAALTTGVTAVTHAFGAGAWDWLCGAGSPLAPWHSAAAVGSMNPDRRVDQIAARGEELPAESWKLALAGTEMPSGAPVVAAWVGTHPELSDDLAAWIFQGLDSSRSRLEDGLAARKVISAMLDRRTRSANVDLDRVLADAEQLEALYRDAKRVAGDDRNPALHEFAVRVAPHVAFFCSEIGGLLVNAADQSGTEKLERAAGDWAAPCIVRALDAAVCRAGDVEAVERALSLYDSGTEIQSAAASEFLLTLMDSRAGRQRLEVVRDSMDRSWVPVLDRMTEESKKGRLSRNVMRGGKRIFSKER